MAKKKVEVIDNKAERIINEYRYNLTVQQQLFLEANVSAGSKELLKLTRNCFNDELLDEQSEEFSRVKNYLVKLRRGKQAHDFSDDELEFISQNGSFMKPVEIARQLYPEAQGPLAKESQSIAELVKAWDIEYDDPTRKDDSVNGDYEPPRTVGKIIELINKADANAKYHMNHMLADPKKKECVTALKRNMNSPRFKMVANSLNRKKLREFFETEFARAAYDKPDLTADENNQYISLCKAYVDEIILFEIISNLNDRLNETVLDNEKEAKLHMSITEALETKTQEAKALRTFITSLQKLLSVTRSERMQDLASLNDSLTRFIQLAQEEKGREQYIRVQEAQIKEIEGEIKKIETYNELIAEIYGIQVSEILNF